MKHKLLFCVVSALLSACAFSEPKPAAVSAPAAKVLSTPPPAEANLPGPIDAAMTGVWIPVSAEHAGKSLSFAPQFRIEIVGDRFWTHTGRGVDAGKLVFFPGGVRAMDVIGEDGPSKGKRLPAIYRINGDEMEVCYDLSGQNRPMQFVSKPGTELFRITYQRSK